MAVYTATMSAVSVSGAITLVQVKAGAAVPLRLLEVRVAQSGSTTSTMQRVRILRKSTAATVTSFTPLKFNPIDPAASAAGGTSATGTNASNENSGDGDVLVDDVFNILNGWLWVPVPQMQIWVPAAGMIGVKFPAAPAAALTVTASITWEELG